MTFLKFPNPPGGFLGKQKTQASLIHLRRQENLRFFSQYNRCLFVVDRFENQESALLLTRLFPGSSLAHPILPQRPVRVQSPRQ